MKAKTVKRQGSEDSSLEGGVLEYHGKHGSQEGISTAVRTVES